MICSGIVDFVVHTAIFNAFGDQFEETSRRYACLRSREDALLILSG